MAGLAAAGDPLAGIAAGAALGQAFQEAGAELEQRLLGPAERARAGAVYLLAVARIKDRLDRGDHPRDDGFFLTTNAGKVPAEEIVENVLLRARNSPDDRKLPHLAALLEFFAFTNQIGADHARHLLVVAERLTYRQLVAIDVLADKELREALPDWSSSGGLSWPDAGVVLELQDLAAQGLLSRDDRVPIFSFADINPRRLQPLHTGAILREGMALKEIPVPAREALIRELGVLGKIVLPATLESAGGIEPAVPDGQLG